MGRKTTSYSLADKLKKENVMQRKLTTLALTITALTFGSGVSAKTLVYCSEGSPENFNPQLYTSGTSVDASASCSVSQISGS